MKDPNKSSSPPDEELLPGDPREEVEHLIDLIAELNSHQPLTSWELARRQNFWADWEHYNERLALPRRFENLLICLFATGMGAGSVMAIAFVFYTCFVTTAHNIR